jgi:iron complex transport system substrate-binding protein
VGGANIVSASGRSSLKRLAAAIFLVLDLFTARATAEEAREIVDMAGRRVTVPTHIGKVFGASPPTTLLLYALAPETLVALNAPLRGDEGPFLRKEILELPALGGSSGAGRRLNPEEAINRRPDLILSWFDESGAPQGRDAILDKAGAPIVYVKLGNLPDHAAAFRFLGELLGKKERAEALAAYIEAAVVRVSAASAATPDEAKVKVYYAMSPDGLATACAESFHSEPIRVAGGDNVYSCEGVPPKGMPRIGLERIMLLQPQMVLAQDRSFLEDPSTRELWRNVPAVKSGQIFTIPHAPFNWLDRPPSFMRALGVQWLAHLFYPKRFPLDLKAETRRFYALFLGIELTDAQYEQIVAGTDGERRP